MKYSLYKISIMCSCLFFTSGDATSHDKMFFSIDTLENASTRQKLNAFTEKLCLSLEIKKPELLVFVVDTKGGEYNAIAGQLVKDSKKSGVAFGALLLKKWEKNWFTDQEIEALLAHELCHIKNKDGVKSKRVYKVASYLKYMSGIIPVVPLSCGLVQNAHSRQQEKRADLQAMGLINDSLDLARVIIKLDLLAQKEPATIEEFNALFATKFEPVSNGYGKLTNDVLEVFMDHPQVRKRIRYIIKHSSQKEVSTPSH
jgi:Zn-dependent protease with chaperone function